MKARTLERSGEPNSITLENYGIQILIICGGSLTVRIADDIRPT